MYVPMNVYTCMYSCMHSDISLLCHILLFSSTYDFVLVCMHACVCVCVYGVIAFTNLNLTCFFHFRNNLNFRTL